MTGQEKEAQELVFLSIFVDVADSSRQFMSRGVLVADEETGKYLVGAPWMVAEKT